MLIRLHWTNMSIRLPDKVVWPEIFGVVWLRIWWLTSRNWYLSLLPKFDWFKSHKSMSGINCGIWFKCRAIYSACHYKLEFTYSEVSPNQYYGDNYMKLCYCSNGNFIKWQILTLEYLIIFCFDKCRKSSRHLYKTFYIFYKAFLL